MDRNTYSWCNDFAPRRGRSLQRGVALGGVTAASDRSSFRDLAVSGRSGNHGVVSETFAQTGKVSLVYVGSAAFTRLRGQGRFCLVRDASPGSGILNVQST